MRRDTQSQVATLKAYLRFNPQASHEQIAMQFGYSYATARRMVARLASIADDDAPEPALAVPLTIGQHTYLIPKL